jgi:hypothetical protein
LLKDKLLSFLQTGYVDISDTVYKGNLAKALRALNETVVTMGNYLVGNANCQLDLNTTALAGLALTSTANAATKIQNVMDGTSWINGTGTSNYTRQTTASITNETATDSGDHTTYSTSQTSLVSGRVVKKNGETITTGFTITGTSVVFDTANAAEDVITLTYNYTIAQPYLKVTTPGTPAVIVANAVTINTANYAVLKTVQSLGTGTIKYELSRDGGTTYTRIYEGAGVFLGEQPTGTDVVIKITITGNATLSKFGISFR